jgi:hypothetical protein
MAAESKSRSYNYLTCLRRIGWGASTHRKKEYFLPLGEIFAHPGGGRFGSGRVGPTVWVDRVSERLLYSLRCAGGLIY